MKKILLRLPDDWHCHLRDGDYLQRTVADTSRCFARAIIMPNLSPPIVTMHAAHAYRQRIEAAIPQQRSFQPLMTFYLNTQITAEEIIQGKKQALIFAGKLYPAGATTHSAAGVQNVQSLYRIFEVMQREQLPLLIHSESTAADVDLIHREAHFIETQVAPLLSKFPELRVVLEHISTKTAVDFVLAGGKNLAATITPHHLCLTLNDLLADGIRPHYYCKPIVNQLSDREALIKAAISGNPKFFLGTDSAPHAKEHKTADVGCAGIYSAHAAIELYAEIFASHKALDKLEDFASVFGARFYQLPLNEKTLTLINKPWTVPESLSFGAEKLVPFYAGETLQWQIEHENRTK